MLTPGIVGPEKPTLWKEAEVVRLADQPLASLALDVGNKRRYFLFIGRSATI